MKKAIINLVFASFFFIGIFIGNVLTAGEMHTIVPGKDKNKKEVTSSKKATSKKTMTATEHKVIDSSFQEEEEHSSQDKYNDNNPALNDDCTKEGFDKE